MSLAAILAGIVAEIEPAPEAISVTAAAPAAAIDPPVVPVDGSHALTHATRNAPAGPKFSRRLLDLPTLHTIAWPPPESLCANVLTRTPSQYQSIDPTFRCAP